MKSISMIYQSFGAKAGMKDRQYNNCEGGII